MTLPNKYKSRGELYCEIVDLVKFRDMETIKREMIKVYRVDKAHLLTVEQLTDWIVKLRALITAKTI